MPRILLVDDDHQRLLDREDLSGEGYEVIEAHDGHEAPKRLDEVSPDAISPGGVIVGATVHHSILSPHVSIDAGTLVEESIPMPDVRSGAGARIPRAIVNERVVVPADMVLGHDTDADARRFTVTPNGVTVVAEGTVVG